jgi:hypothetical protein
MRELPILFSAPMVRAILEGRKTVTRRVVKPQPYVDGCGNFCWNGWNYGQDIGRRPHVQAIASPLPSSRTKRVLCPYGAPGDRLWVRERFKPVASGQVKNGYGEVRYGYAYEADGNTRWNERPTIIHDLTGQPNKGPMQFRPSPWRAAVTMPHRATRLWLEVTAVRVERLQDITEDQAEAEGVAPGDLCEDEVVRPSPRYVNGFRMLWNELAKDGMRWADNPWVWVVEFQGDSGGER